MMQFGERSQYLRALSLLEEPRKMYECRSQPLQIDGIPFSESINGPTVFFVFSISFLCELTSLHRCKVYTT